jgi:hypothetical protein
MGNKQRWIKITRKLIALVLVSATVASCVPTASKGTSRGRKSATLNGAVINVGVTQGAVLTDNPIILSGNTNLAMNADLNSLASVAFITNDSFLRSNLSCAGLEYCFEVRETKDSSSALQTSDGKWGFSTDTEEFLQVNTFYHLNKVFDQFFENLQISRALAYDAGGIPTFDSAIPSELYNLDGTFNLSNRHLTAYSNCDVENNAFFDRTNETLCFGYTKGAKKLRWATDSTIVYHEAGHYFQKLQLNLRNISGAVVNAELGGIQYDEAGSIGEGLADFFSYYMNGRSHWGEWAAGRFLQASRPISEDDALHSPGISADREQRLTYPQYVNYDPNYPKTPAEDIHLSGMIISHYLVALTQELQTKCSMPQKEAVQNVMHLVTETLAELGDLTTTGTGPIVGGTTGKINLDPLYASEWQRKVNPITFRSFAQTMAKNLYNNLGDPTLQRCGGGVYSRDNIEALLDDYGLLLFKTYNENRNLGNGTPITPTNRKKSILIVKNALMLDPSPEANAAFVIDNRAQIAAGIKALQSSGILQTTLSQQTPSDLGFNNGNSKVSPGEVVAIALNLYNNSNSQMGGVQVLANDWNHADSTGKPYRFPASMSNDQWPLISEGGIDFPAITPIEADSADDFAPVCFMQLNDSGSTKWVSQKEFQAKMALSDSMCLNPTTNKDCFVRALKGADQAHFSKINPKSTWGQTMAEPETGKAYSLNWGNVIMFEVSKHIPPGTTIDCRLRLRFTNCEDCYHDSLNSNNDFKDLDYNGPRPFKIIHLQIPITD